MIDRELRTAIALIPLRIIYVHPSEGHVEMTGADAASTFFVTATVKEGALVKSGMTVEQLAPLSESLYVARQDSASMRSLGESEIIGPDGLCEELPVNVIFAQFGRT